LNVTNVSTNSAILNWTTAAGNFYTVDYKMGVSGSWINAATGISNGTFTLLNLSQATVYDWRVSANCAPAPANNYGTAQFTTKAHNGQITDLKDGYGLKISPNPLTGAALIDYILADNGNVTIEIINPQGQRLQKLLAMSQIRGQYQLPVTTQLANLAKGVYFLRLVQNNRGQVIKFVKY